MDMLDIAGVAVPLPDGWEMPPEGRSYLGEDGLLDVRVVDVSKPITQERLRIATEKLSERNANVELLEVQGFKCLFCSYRKDGCLVVTYSFDVDQETEVRAVYAFVDGSELRADVVAQQIGQMP